jgi:hypothetical protein
MRTLSSPILLQISLTSIVRCCADHKVALTDVVLWASSTGYFYLRLVCKEEGGQLVGVSQVGILWEVGLPMCKKKVF